MHSLFKKQIIGQGILLSSWLCHLLQFLCPTRKNPYGPSKTTVLSHLLDGWVNQNILLLYLHANKKKAVHIHTIKAYWGSISIIPYILHLEQQMDASGQLHAIKKNSPLPNEQYARKTPEPVWMFLDKEKSVTLDENHTMIPWSTLSQVTND